jgi:hypothetical protein
MVGIVAFLGLAEASDDALRRQPARIEVLCA